MFVVALLVTFSNKGLLRRIMLESELRDKETRIAQLKSEIATLREQKRRIETENSEVEHIAREVHGMVRQGEIVYKVQHATPPDVK